MENFILRDVNARVKWLSGNCPVQAEGSIGKKRFYFRSRWNQWQISVGTVDPIIKPEFVYGEPWGKEPGDAGYMPNDTAIMMMIKGLELYKEWINNGETTNEQKP